MEKAFLYTSVFRWATFIFFLFCCNNSIIGQQKISGLVVDEDHHPVDGASINIKGSNTGTISAPNGTFSIIAKAGDILKVSCVGLLPKDVIIENGALQIIILSFATGNMEEVVVIGYGTAKKKDLTGSVASVSAKNFNKGVFTSPDQLIQGKVSGLQITKNNGLPGAAATIKIRGNSALSGTGQPLFVIDGIPLDGRSQYPGDNPLNFINPADVASVDVLKDASATAIYGSRAAYGVIMINTKKGQSTQPRINAAASAGVSSILKKIEILNPPQFREAIQYYGVSGSNDKGANEDAFNAILQHGFQTDYSVSISGGNENGNYRLSGNSLNQEGIIRNSDFKKYNAALSASFKFLENKNLGLDINLNASQYIQNHPLPGQYLMGVVNAALKWNPTESLRNADGSFKKVSGIVNPLASTELVKNNLKVTTVFGSVAPYYKITDWLEYKLLLGINYGTSIYRYSVHQDLDPTANAARPGTAFVRNSELITKQLTHTLKVDKKISSALTLNAVVGFEYTKFVSKGFSATGYGVLGTGLGNFGLDYTNYIQYSDPNGRSISSFADPNSELQSYFGRAIFNYEDKYLLTATLRVDGSSKFGENNKYGYFPSFAGAWYISKEKFFKTDFINSLKMRIGWGNTGNQEFPAGSAQARYSFFDGGVIRQVNNPNPDLKWQSDRQLNIGFDFSIFNNIVSGTIDYFHKTTSNLLFPSLPIQPSPLPVSSFSTMRWVNLDGEIKNKGLELLINASLIKRQHISFDIGVNATFLKNKVTGLTSPVYTGNALGPTQIIQNDRPMNAFYTLKFLGLNKTTGFSLYEDNGASLYYVGNANPDFLLGINPVIQYKKFTLSANMYGVFGHDIFYEPLMAVLNVGSFTGGSNMALSLLRDPVKEALTNLVTPSSRYILKGNYLKMANLTLSYELGNVKKILKGVNIYITGQNLILLTKYPGFDPETNGDASINGIPSLGIDYLQYPSARTILFGINFSL